MDEQKQGKFDIDLCMRQIKSTADMKVDQMILQHMIMEKKKNNPGGNKNE